LSCQFRARAFTRPAVHSKRRGVASAQIWKESDRGRFVGARRRDELPQSL